jgi:hypothetical protein
MIMSDRVEEQHRIHARATGLNQSGKAENLNFNKEKMGEARKAGAVLSHDVVSWGRGGQVEVTPERSAPPMSEAAAKASGSGAGFSPEPVAGTSTGTSTEPSALGTKLRPVPNSASGNMNMSAIEEATKISAGWRKP